LSRRRSKFAQHFSGAQFRNSCSSGVATSQGFEPDVCVDMTLLHTGTENELFSSS
jgi:hypothetical protein